MLLVQGFCKRLLVFTQLSKRFLSSDQSQMLNLANMAKTNSNNIVWVDMEMTGLDPDKDKILEIACLVTNENLNIISEELDIVIHQSDEVLNNMNKWCRVHHEKTGLTDEARKSLISLEQAEEQLIQFLEKYIPKATCPLAGNTIYMDRVFMMKQMPRLNNYIHYRIIDVSTVKEVVKRWNIELFKRAPTKKLNHRALQDIKESITELSYYKNHIFLNNK